MRPPWRNGESQRCLARPLPGPLPAVRAAIGRQAVKSRQCRPSSALSGRFPQSPRCSFHGWPHSPFCLLCSFSPSTAAGVFSDVFFPWPLLASFPIPSLAPAQLVPFSTGLDLNSTLRRVALRCSGSALRCSRWLACWLLLPLRLAPLSPSPSPSLSVSRSLARTAVKGAFSLHFPLLLVAGQHRSPTAPS